MLHQVIQKCSAVIFWVLTMANLHVVSTAYLRAVFDMSDIKGEIRFTEVINGTRIVANLTGITSDLTWKIHKYPVVYSGNSAHTCKMVYTGGMFDPSGLSSELGYTMLCNKTSPNLCALGDLSGKHGHLNSSTNHLIDPNLPLNGSNSIFGRSVVLYDNSSTPWACALIDYDDVITAVTTFRGAVSGVTGTVRLRQPRGDVSRDTSVEIDLFYSNDAVSGTGNWTLEIAAKNLPEDGRPSFEGDVCEMTTERALARNISISLAQDGPSVDRSHFSLSSLPLDGPMSAIGKSLVLKHNGSPVICGSVYEVVPLEAEAVFDVDGVTGWFRFKQESELAPTVVTADIKGLAGKAGTYHVHVHKVLDTAMQKRQNAHGMCSNDFVAGHWRPYDTISAPPGNGTVDKYEVGDLSGKYGKIGENDTTISLNRKDYNLPLFGGKSIMFRSMVIHYKNTSRWVCSNINPRNAKFLFKTKSKFVGPDFNGSIVIEQATYVKEAGASHITSFFVDLKPINRSEEATQGHNWHIHDKDIVDDQMGKMGTRCKSAAGHYNPYKVSLKGNYANTCGPNNLLRCELGDCSNKLGKYTIGGGKNRFVESENYLAGVNTILGRSVVVHDKDGGAPRAGCANMQLISPSFVRRELVFRNTTASASDLSMALAASLKVNHWRVHVAQFHNYHKKCQKAKLILLDSTGSNLGADYDRLIKDWPDSLEKFSPARDVDCKDVRNPEDKDPDHAFNLQATSLLLAIGFLLTCMLV